MLLAIIISLSKVNLLSETGSDFVFANFTALRFTSRYQLYIVFLQIINVADLIKFLYNICFNFFIFFFTYLPNSSITSVSFPDGFPIYFVVIATAVISIPLLNGRSC